MAETVNEALPTAGENGEYFGENGEYFGKNGEYSGESGVEIKGTSEQDTAAEQSKDDLQEDQETAELPDGNNKEPNDSDENFMTFENGESISTAQVPDYVKKGYEYEKNISPLMKRLERLAATSLKSDGSHYESTDDYLKAFEAAIDENLKARCLEDANGDEDLANELFESRRTKREENYSQFINDKAKAENERLKTDTERVAAEFEDLQREFPEIKSYSELPRAVKEIAAKFKMSLLSAKLLLEHRDRKAENELKQKSMSAAQSSLGSQSGTGNSESLEVLAMLKGINR